MGADASAIFLDLRRGGGKEGEGKGEEGLLARVSRLLPFFKK